MSLMWLHIGGRWWSVSSLLHREPLYTNHSKYSSIDAVAVLRHVLYGLPSAEGLQRLSEIVV